MASHSLFQEAQPLIERGEGLLGPAIGVVADILLGKPETDRGRIEREISPDLRSALRDVRLQKYLARAVQGPDRAEAAERQPPQADDESSHVVARVRRRVIVPVERHR